MVNGGVGIRLIMLPLLTLGLLCAIAIAQPGYESADQNSQMTFPNGHDWLTPDYLYYPSYYSRWYPSYYYSWYPSYSYYYPYNYYYYPYSYYYPYRYYNYYWYW